MTLPVAVTGPLTPAQQSSIVNLVRRAARAEILPRFRALAQGDISTKSGPQDLVTSADTAAEAMIARGLARMFPGAVILGEEASSEKTGSDKPGSAGDAGSASLRDRAAEAELAFVIDPLDGTWNFVNGLGVFGVILAATRYGRPIFGLIHDPLADDHVIALSDAPARHVARNGHVTTLTLPPAGALDGLSGYVHMAHMPQDQQEILAPLLPRFARSGALRCSAHEYRQMAQGRVDFILSGVMTPWDHAAGVLICQRAGGVARMLDGSDYTIGTREGHLLCATDAATWDALAAHFAPLAGDAADAAAPGEASETEAPSEAAPAAG